MCHNEYLLRAKNATYIPFYSINNNLSCEPEKCLLLDLPKTIARCIIFLRLNPFCLRIGNSSLNLESDPSQCKFCPDHLSTFHFLNCVSSSSLYLGSGIESLIGVGKFVSTLLPGDRDVSF